MSKPHTVHAEILIAAPPERVWAAVTDFQSFPRWNPFIVEARGRLQPGARLFIRLRLFGPVPVTFKPTVTVVEANRELRWLARVLRPGVFDTDRVFRIEPEGTGGARLIQHESCSGVLAPLLFAAGLARPIAAGYQAMNLALKRRLEQPAGGAIAERGVAATR